VWLCVCVSICVCVLEYGALHMASSLRMLTSLASRAVYERERERVCVCECLCVCVSVCARIWCAAHGKFITNVDLLGIEGGV